MNTVLLLLILVGLVGLLLVAFYLLDRINSLHQHTATRPHGANPDDSFGGLSGKALWDAMIGVPTPGWDNDKLAPLRLRYEAVLQKHAELLFEDGELDGREGFSMPVSCERTVPTLRGEIKSWMPHDYASAIYRCGHHRASLPQDEHGDIRRTLDQTGMMLFAAVGLPPHGLSMLLMPQLQALTSPETPEANAPAAPQANAQAVPALAAPQQAEQSLTLTPGPGELQGVPVEMATAPVQALNPASPAVTPPETPPSPA